MARPLSGPSDGLLLWTRYLLLLIASLVAFVVLLDGNLVGKAGATILLWRTLESLRTFKKG